MKDSIQVVLSHLGADVPVEQVADFIREQRMRDGSGAIFGWGWADLAEGGDLKQRSYFGNLITTTGDQYYARWGSGVSTPSRATGMRTGYSNAAVGKSGTASYINSYMTGKVASKAFDGSYPTCEAIGTDIGWRITYKTSYGTSESNLDSNSIAEVVITNATIADEQGTAANTLSRALVSPAVPKTSSDTFAVTWQHDFYDAP